MTPAPTGLPGPNFALQPAGDRSLRLMDHGSITPIPNILPEDTVRRTTRLLGGLESLEDNFPIPSPCDVSPPEGGAHTAPLPGQGPTDSTILGGTTVVWRAEVVVPSAPPPRISLLSQQGSHTSPGVTETTHLEFLRAALSRSYTWSAV